MLAFDIGASSGRAIRAVYTEGKLSWREVLRFENNPYEENGHLRWNFPALMAQVRRGLEKAGPCDSVAFDTWGVDFGLLDSAGKLLGNPFHYRDVRTKGIVEKALEKMRAKDLYFRTGNQIMEINTLFQLLAFQKQDPEILDEAETLLFMPDLFIHSLCGKRVCERSIASTSQMFSPTDGKWSTEVLKTFQIPRKILLDPVSGGTVVGSLPGGEKVIAVAGHDTQCAVAAMPAEDQNAAFLSCGTWSLIGTELDRPVLSEESCRLGLSNELGANGKIDYLKNITGLWLIQESRREWRRQGFQYSFSDLEHLASKAEPMRCFIDSDSPEFLTPGDIPRRVQKFCTRTRQPIPRTTGEIMRCIYESLALKYRDSLDQIQRMTGKRFTVLYILGGGTRDHLLCQMSAGSTGLPVVAGSAEATAMGNFIIQLAAGKVLPDIDTGREIIAKSGIQGRYQPENTEKWEKAYQIYREIIKE